MEKFIWSEKYAPKLLSDCVLPESTYSLFKNIIDSKEIPNLLFHGKAGTGKTTMANVLCHEMNMLPLFINGSKDSGIDVLRNNIESFVSSRSLDNKKKVVILDECDYLNAQSTQPALRSFMDKHQSKCGFIFTCNYPQKLIEPLISRCTVIDFTLNKNDITDVLKKSIVRVIRILKNEGVEFNKQGVVDLCKKHFPDFRKTLGELQKAYIQDNEIVENALDFEENELDELFKNMKQKNYTNVRKFCINADTSSIFTRLYNELFTRLKPEDIPPSIITLADYQYKGSFVADRELNLLACLSELMFNAEFI